MILKDSTKKHRIESVKESSDFLNRSVDFQHTRGSIHLDNYIKKNSQTM